MRIFVLGGVICHDEDSSFEEEKQRLSEACRKIGFALGNNGHNLIVCSPFEDSADVEILRGVVASKAGTTARVEFHFVDSLLVREKLESLVKSLGLTNVSRVPHPPPRVETPQGYRFAWLLCQLNALEVCNVTVAIGGEQDGASNMLLLLAESKRKPVIPFAFLGGAAERAFIRKQYELEDRIGKQFSELQDFNSCESVAKLAEVLASSAIAGLEGKKSTNLPVVFISYSRERPGEADYSEILLRRRSIPVFRDESDFGAGHSIPSEIIEKIHSSEVFLAFWCKEYACSPWCYDELELALDRYEAGKLKLWIFLLDETRMVPKRARGLLAFPIKTKEALSEKLLELLWHSKN